MDLSFIQKYNLNYIELIEIWQQHPLIKFIQIRAKDSTEREIKTLYWQIKDRFPQLKIIINDKWKLAVKLHSFGFHLGKEDYEKLSEQEKKEVKNLSLFKGTSCHTIKDLENLEDHWNYTGFGPIFETKTKKSSYTPIGLENLKKLPKNPSISIFLIGGLNVENIQEILKINDFRIASISYVSKKINLKRL